MKRLLKNMKNEMMRCNDYTVPEPNVLQNYLQGRKPVAEKKFKLQTTPSTGIITP